MPRIKYGPVDERVVSALFKLRGQCFDAPTPREATRKVWAASDAEVGLPDFERIMRARGLMAQPIRTGLYRVAIPGRDW